MSKIINLMVNKGDKLINVDIWKIKGTRQSLKQEFNIKHSLRRFLINEGFAHSFFKEFIWLCPLNDDKVGEVEEIPKMIFSNQNVRKIEVESVNLTDPDLWYNLGVVLLRDAVRYSLLTKLNNDKLRDKFIVTLKREVYKKEFIKSWFSTGVVVGVSFNRIFRMDGNICICPLLVYDCCYSNFQRIEDRKERVKYISRVSSQITPKEYEQRMNNIMNDILPITINLSNKRLIFDDWQYQLVEKRKEKQLTLEMWVRK
jgi:hypothetical protein